MSATGMDSVAEGVRDVKTTRCMLSWAGLVALGLVAPLTAQQPNWSPMPRTSASWSDATATTAGSTMPPTGGPIDGPLLAPGDGLPQRPDTMGPGPMKVPQTVWMEAPTTRQTSAPSNVAPGGTQDRPLKDFGANFKNMLNPKAQPTGSAVAALAVPAGGVVQTRPSWGWHGYGEYNQHAPAPEPGAQPTASSALAAEMAPYMKYAHLWRPTHNGFQNANLAAGHQDAPLPVTNLTPMPMPHQTGPSGWNTSDNSSEAPESSVRRANLRRTPPSRPSRRSRLSSPTARVCRWWCASAFPKFVRVKLRI